MFLFGLHIVLAFWDRGRLEFKFRRAAGIL